MTSNCRVFKFLRRILRTENICCVFRVKSLWFQECSAEKKKKKKKEWAWGYASVSARKNQSNIPWSIFTATVIVEFAIFLDVLLTDWPVFIHKGAFKIPLQTLPKAPWPSSSHRVTSLLFNSHLSLVSSFFCSLCLLFPLQHQFFMASPWVHVYCF